MFQDQIPWRIVWTLLVVGNLGGAMLAVGIAIMFHPECQYYFNMTVPVNENQGCIESRSWGGVSLAVGLLLSPAFAFCLKYFALRRSYAFGTV